MKITRKRVDKYFKMIDEIENIYFDLVALLEKQMAKEIGTKDLEFVWVDGCIVGIGTPTRKKKIKLIHR